MTDGPAPQDAIELGINVMSTMVGQTAAEKGFHQAFDDAVWLEALAKELHWKPRTAARLRDIATRHRMLEIGTKLMLVVSELGEALESLRDTGFEGHLQGEGNFDEEIADAQIRLGDLSSFTGNETPGQDITKKMGVNSNRPQLHGRKM